MSSPGQYTIYKTTAWDSRRPDTKSVYGKLLSDGKEVSWPETLTTVSVAGLTQPAFVTPTAVTRSEYIETGTGLMLTVEILGQFLDQGNPVPWPATATGPLLPPPNPPPGAPPETSSVTTSIPPEPSPVASSSLSAHSQSSIPTSSAGHGHSGLSAGAIAGIAIGCAIVGIIIGLTASCYFLRYKRAKNHSSRPYELDGKPAHPAHELDSNTYTEKDSRDVISSSPLQQLSPKESV